ncbi:hypothetical protein [Deinococcus piscis]|nr:hypothetical protein [Deinococcus piscis]
MSYDVLVIGGGSVPDRLKETLSGSQKNMKQGGLWRCETEPSRPDEC